MLDTVEEKERSVVEERVDASAREERAPGGARHDVECTLEREGLSCRTCSDGAMSRIRGPHYLPLRFNDTKAPFDGMITPGSGRAQNLHRCLTISWHGQRHSSASTEVVR